MDIYYPDPSLKPSRQHRRASPLERIRLPPLRTLPTSPTSPTSPLVRTTSQGEQQQATWAPRSGVIRGAPTRREDGQIVSPVLGIKKAETQAYSRGVRAGQHEANKSYLKWTEFTDGNKSFYGVLNSDGKTLSEKSLSRPLIVDNVKHINSNSNYVNNMIAHILATNQHKYFSQLNNESSWILIINKDDLLDTRHLKLENIFYGHVSSDKISLDNPSEGISGFHFLDRDEFDIPYAKLKDQETEKEESKLSERKEKKTHGARREQDLDGLDDVEARRSRRTRALPRSRSVGGRGQRKANKKKGGSRRKSSRRKSSRRKSSRRKSSRRKSSRRKSSRRKSSRRKSSRNKKKTKRRTKRKR
jgi:hypothetical protein